MSDLITRKERRELVDAAGFKDVDQRMMAFDLLQRTEEKLNKGLAYPVVVDHKSLSALLGTIRNLIWRGMMPEDYSKDSKDLLERTWNQMWNEYMLPRERENVTFDEMRRRAEVFNRRMTQGDL